MLSHRRAHWLSLNKGKHRQQGTKWSLTGAHRTQCPCGGDGAVCPLASPGWTGRTNTSMCQPWALARSGICNVHLHGDSRRRVGFFLCWLKDQVIESYIFLVNWWNNGVFGQNVGSSTQVSDQAMLETCICCTRALQCKCQNSSSSGLDLAVPRVIYILSLRARSTKLLSWGIRNLNTGGFPTKRWTLGQ